jgi:1-acyl-sn-glycerol-3-phosphate acyltransferase
MASGLSLIWASRMAQVFQIEVFVEKSSESDAIRSGKEIFAISHKSFLDFCLAPFVYIKLNADGSAKSFMPRIMVAKDHFKDNFFLYRVIGLGQMLEAWGMIFVDRKSKKAGKAEQAVSLTVKRLLASDMAFSVYPQGTRAWGQLGRGGSRSA